MCDKNKIITSSRAYALYEALKKDLFSYNVVIEPCFVSKSDQLTNLQIIKTGYYNQYYIGDLIQPTLGQFANQIQIVTSSDFDIVDDRSIKRDILFSDIKTDTGDPVGISFNGYKISIQFKS